MTSNGVTVCGSKFPPTVSKHCQHQHCAIHKTVQQYEIPTIPAVVLSKVLFPQSNIRAAFVHSNTVSSCLPTYNKHNITKLNFYSVQPLPADPFTLLHTMSKSQYRAVHFNLSMPHCNLLTTLFNRVTNYKYWIVAEWNSRCRFRLVFEMVYWRWIGISVIIVIHIIFIKLTIN